MGRELTSAEVMTVVGGDEVVTTGAIMPDSVAIDPFDLAGILAEGNQLLMAGLNQMFTQTQFAPGNGTSAPDIGDEDVPLRLVDEDGTLIDEVTLVFNGTALDNDDGPEIENWETQIVDVLYEITGIAYNVEYNENTGNYHAAPLVI